MPTVGYVPFEKVSSSAEAGWLSEHLSLDVRIPSGMPSLNGPVLPPFEQVASVAEELIRLPAVVAEGPGGMLWAAAMRVLGFAGSVTVLPYLNLRGWRDVAAAALYRRFATENDRVFIGSTPSAAVYRACGVQAIAGEPYGIDDKVFALRPWASRTREALAIPEGRLLLFAGRVQPDKDLYLLLRVCLRAQVLFPDLQVVVASHVVDHAYLAAAREQLGDRSGVRFILDPTRPQLADLYNVADVFVTASTSHFETFGRAPAEALACGTPAIAPRYDGFVEVLDQVGGTLVDLALAASDSAPQVGEDDLLRSIYEVLSARRPPQRQQISIAARSRFGRSVTIGMLRYLTGDAAPPIPPPVSAAVIEFPAAWREPLAEIAGRDAAAALAWFWQECDHQRFSTWDDDFSAVVRRSLCVAPKAQPLEILTGCL